MHGRSPCRSGGCRVRLALTLALALAVLVLAPSAHARKSADGAIRKMDRDGDGRLDREEWRKKGIFGRIDGDGDGYLSRRELQLFFGEITPAGDEAAGRPDAESMAAVRRSRHDGVEALRARGLIETGLYPVWGEEVGCRGIDHTYAMDYTALRAKESYHGGIDIPAPFDEPVLAVMDGEVIARYAGERSPRGIELVLRHTPAQSGLPVYVYTRYTHFREMPGLKPGDRVAMGQVLGPTGNTGVMGCEIRGQDCGWKQRRSLLHFDVLYSSDARYFDSGTMIVPFGAQWMDPNALFRGRMPVDSAAMKALPEADKAVAVPYQLRSGVRVPSDTRMVWPYACWPR